MTDNDNRYSRLFNGSMLVHLNLPKLWLVLLLQLFVESCTDRRVYFEEEGWNLKGIPGDGYYIDIVIGTPPQKFNVLVDTGSSNLAIAGAPHDKLKHHFVFKNSSTYVSKEQDVEVTYTEGWWTGHLGRDFVNFPSLGKDISIDTDLAVITSSEGFYVKDSNWQGILGLAYPALAEPNGEGVPWFNALTSKYYELTNNTFTLELCGSHGIFKHYGHFGKMTIGHDDNLSNNAVSKQFAAPIEHEWFYEVTIVSMGVGGLPLQLSCDQYNYERTIVDSGTSNLRLPTVVFDALVSILKHYTEQLDVELFDEFWQSKGGVCWPTGNEEWRRLPNISISLAHNNFSSFLVTLTPDSYLRPPTTQNVWRDCRALGIESSDFGTVLGVAVLEGLIVTFDRENKLILFKESSCGPKVTLNGYFNFTNVCLCTYSSSGVSGVALVAYVMSGILSLLCIPLVVGALWWIWTSRSRQFTHARLPFLNLAESANA